MISSDDIVGKDVIDKTGMYIGVIEKLLFDDTLAFAGISVDRGFLARGLEIGRDHIDRVASHAVFLNTTPAIFVKGRKVIDTSGNKIGKVDEVRISGNKIESITVKEKVFTKSQITSIGEHVVVKG